MSARDTIIVALKDRGISGSAVTYGRDANTILSALTAAGYAVVPVKATEEMETACIKASLAFLIAHKIKAIWPWSRNRRYVRENVRVCYAAMLTAAAQEPTP